MFQQQWLALATQLANSLITQALSGIIDLLCIIFIGAHSFTRKHGYHATKQRVLTIRPNSSIDPRVMTLGCPSIISSTLGTHKICKVVSVYDGPLTYPKFPERGQQLRLDWRRRISQFQY